MSSVLTRLELSIEQEELTVDMSATLCQLTRLQKLGLSADMDTYRDTKNSKATLTLSLPRLEELKIISIALELMCLRCPKLRELVLEEVALEDFDGMPDSIQKLRLDLDDSVDLEVIVPAHSARMLEELLLLGIEGSDFSKPAAVQDLCLNGRLKCPQNDSCQLSCWSVFRGCHMACCTSDSPGCHPCLAIECRYPYNPGAASKS